MKFSGIALLAVLVFCAGAADLTTKSGKVYNGYSIEGPSPKGLVIFFELGGATIPYSDLPDDLRAKYKADEEKAAIVLQAQEEQRKKLEEQRQGLAEQQQKLQDRQAVRNKINRLAAEKMKSQVVVFDSPVILDSSKNMLHCSVMYGQGCSKDNINPNEHFILVTPSKNAVKENKLVNGQDKRTSTQALGFNCITSEYVQDTYKCWRIGYIQNPYDSKKENPYLYQYTDDSKAALEYFKLQVMMENDLGMDQLSEEQKQQYAKNITQSEEDRQLDSIKREIINARVDYCLTGKDGQEGVVATPKYIFTQEEKSYEKSENTTGAEVFITGLDAGKISNGEILGKDQGFVNKYQKLVCWEIGLQNLEEFGRANRRLRKFTVNRDEALEYFKQKISKSSAK